MKVLICGAGNIARELLKWLGDSWEVTLIEKSPEALKRIGSLYPFLARTIEGDASSPVVLSGAGLTDQDYVLALTNDDQVNLAVSEYAIGQGSLQVLARVHDPDRNADFLELGVKTMMVNTMLAKTIHRYLQDPRISYTPLALGRGEIFEIEVSPQLGLVGRTCFSLNNADWRVSAVFRDNQLLFPDPWTVVQPGDRLVIIGEPDVFEPVCDLFECGRPHFPLTYGRDTLLVLRKDGPNPVRLAAESAYFVQNTQVRQLAVLCNEDDEEAVRSVFGPQSGLDVKIHATPGAVWDEMYNLANRDSVGLVVVPPLETSFLKALAKPALITLAHSLPCPLLVARNSQPYKRILVPFNATPRAELALEAAIDLSRQTGGQVTAALVMEPDFFHDAQDEDWLEQALGLIRELAHTHKVQVEEAVRQGNPVKEVLELAEGFDLMVVGSTTKGKGLFSPHVGENLVSKSPCSVLVLAS